MANATKAKAVTIIFSEWLRSWLAIVFSTDLFIGRTAITNRWGDNLTGVGPFLRVSCRHTALFCHQRAGSARLLSTCFRTFS